MLSFTEVIVMACSVTKKGAEMICCVLRKLACSIVLGAFILPVFALADQNNPLPEDLSLTAVTPTAFLERSETIATGKQIQVFRVPTRDATGKIKYYDLTIPLTVGTDGKIGGTASVKSVLSPTVLSNEFVAGSYTDNSDITCTVSTSILQGGRQEVVLTCKDTYRGSNFYASWATGPLSGHPFELDLRADGIDKIPGYQNYAWGKVGNAFEWWDCFYTNRIVSARQVGATIALSCYDGNTVDCGVNLTKI